MSQSEPQSQALQQANTVSEYRRALRLGRGFEFISHVTTAGSAVLDSEYKKNEAERKKLKRNEGDTDYEREKEAALQALKRVRENATENTSTENECAFCRASKFTLGIPRSETYTVKKNGSLMHQDCAALMSKGEDQRAISDRVLCRVPGADDDWTLASHLTELLRSASDSATFDPIMRKETEALARSNRVSAIFKAGRADVNAEAEVGDNGQLIRQAFQSRFKDGEHVLQETGSGGTCAWCYLSCRTLGVAKGEVARLVTTTKKCEACGVFLHEECAKAWHLRGRINETRWSDLVLMGSGLSAPSERKKDEK